MRKQVMYLTFGIGALAWGAIAVVGGGSLPTAFAQTAEAPKDAIENWRKALAWDVDGRAGRLSPRERMSSSTSASSPSRTWSTR